MFNSLFSKVIAKIARKVHLGIQTNEWENQLLILEAKNLMASESWRSLPDFSNPKWIQNKEFRVYSQFGDDGIIQYLINYLQLNNGGGKNFIEFGVGDFFESNSHFLLVNNGWNGYVMDGSIDNIKRIVRSSIYWRYNINAKQAFIDMTNINSLLFESGFKKADVFHLDLDGNDYWILDAIDLKLFDPEILILEYNAIFGAIKAFAIPYDAKFYRMNAHYSGKYFGASLQALNDLAARKGFYFIGCNSAGNNAYFLAARHQSTIPRVSVESGFQGARFRESRNINGELSYLDPSLEPDLLKGLNVCDVRSGVNLIL